MKRKVAKKIRVTIDLPAHVHEELDDLVDATGGTKGSVVCRAIEMFAKVQLLKKEDRNLAITDRRNHVVANLFVF